MAAYLREQKREALRAGLYRLFVVDEEQKEQTEVLPAVFRGVPLGIHEARTPHGTVTFDLYAHATPGERRVEVIGRGGNRLLEDLASIETFRNDVWASGQIEGTITDAYLEPTTGRTGVFQDRRHYLNAQHPDYLAATAARERGDARPLLVFQMGLLWKEYLLTTDPYATAARQTDELAGLVSRSQKHLPTRL